MTALSPRSRVVIDNFGREQNVTAEQVFTLRKILNDSPALADQLNDAVAEGSLRKLVPLTGSGAGGQYHGADRSIHLPLAKLTPLPVTACKAEMDAFHGEATFVMGRELAHGCNHATRMEALKRFTAEASSVARDHAPIHDYSAVLNDRLGAERQNEADAEIAGWNAVVSAVGRRNPNPTLRDIHQHAPARMGAFIELDEATGHHSLRPHLTLNPDLTLSPTSANVEAVAQHYFDKQARQAHLGPYGRSDYASHYGAAAVADVVQVERHHNPPQHGVETPRIAIDMASLRLDGKLLEESGIDLGKDTRPMPYHDLSSAPPALRHFDHTTTPAQVAITAASISPDDPTHPDHAMLLQIREGVRKIDDGIGKPYDEMSERISRSLLAACKDNRDAHPDAAAYSLAANALNRVDHVFMGSNGNLFAVEGRLDDPVHKRCHVSTQQAIQTTVEHSDQKLQTALQAIAQEQQPAQQNTPAREVDAPARGTPTQ